MARLIKLSAENFMGLTVAHIVPNEKGVTKIIGENEAGKTSALDAITIALGGTGGSPAMPIKKGATSAEVIVDLGEIIVTRTWSQKSGTSLEVKNAKGVKQKAPQALLDSFFAKLSFDPLAFQRMEAPKQMAVIAEIAGLDLAKSEAERLAVFNERTAVNRQLEAAKSQLVALPKVPDDVLLNLPEVELKLTDIMDEMTKAEAVNKSCDKIELALRGDEQRMVTTQQNIEKAKLLPNELQTERERKIASINYEYERMIKDANEQLSKASVEFRSAEADVNDKRELAAKSKRVDVEPIKQRGRDAEAINAHIRTKKARDERAKALEELEKKADDLSAKLIKLAGQKKAAIAKAKLPIEELALADGGVTIKGVPFDQCSAAQRLKTSVAIGMALNPKLKLMLVRDGSLLDEKNMKLLAEMAEAADAQVLVERVDSGAGEVGIRIVDGETVS